MRSNAVSFLVELLVCKASVPCTNGFVVGGESRLLSDELSGTSALVYFWFVKEERSRMTMSVVGYEECLGSESGQFFYAKQIRLTSWAKVYSADGMPSFSAAISVLSDSIKKSNFWISSCMER